MHATTQKLTGIRSLLIVPFVDLIGRCVLTRNRASAKKAGADFERLVADYLAERMDDDRIDRRVKTGNKDRGDVGGLKTIRGGRVVIECKSVSRDNLPLWIREAEIERGNDDAVIGVVAHKRFGTAQPAEQYVTMTLASFALLLEGGPDVRPVVVLDPMRGGVA